MKNTRVHVEAVIVLTLAMGFTLPIGGNGSAQSRVEALRAMCRGKAATIVGTPGNDVIAGTAEGDVIVGRGGLDRIYGDAGDDIICGGSGRRPVGGGLRLQQLSGGPGNDVIVGGRDTDVIDDRSGQDLLIGRGSRDFLVEFDQGLVGNPDILRGGQGSDSLLGDRGADELLGQAGDDRLLDWVGDNSLIGGSGDDRLESSRGNDFIVGGSGIDTAAYVYLFQARGVQDLNCNNVTADLSAGVAFGTGFGVDTLRGVEDLATGGGEDVLKGDANSNNFFVGTPCDGVLLQQESVAGGDGWDGISFDNERWEHIGSVGPVLLDLGAGTATQRSADGQVEVRVALDSIENATGTSDEDTILGDDGPNHISAGPRDSSGDVIRGRGGDDDLRGSDQSDVIYGDEGADNLRGLSGDDRLDGGSDDNTVRGGPGTDNCQNPDRYNGALSCET